MSRGTLILRAKAYSAVNAVRHMEAVMYFHVVAAVGMVTILLAGGTYLFYRVFDFLMRQDVFGPPLMNSLVGIVFLAFFSMLIFSNLIITLSTSYISKEVDFLMAQPIDHAQIFRQKLMESIIYSSWAFVVLSLPFFVAFGVSRDVAWHFYPLVALLLIPFLVIPAAVGAVLTMLVTAFLPARRTRLLVVGLGVLSLAVALVLARLMNFRRLFSRADAGNFSEIMSFLEFGSSPLLPSSWMVNGLLAIGPSNPAGFSYANYLYWLAMLTSTALFLMRVAYWLVPPLYYRGWSLTKDSANRGEVSQSMASPLNVVDKVLFFLPTQWRALIAKDMKTFWRDPAQWTQLVILFGLMIIYITNLRSAQRYSDTVVFLVDRWKTLVAFFNLGATCFILSILTTRFVYPMLSLEGRQFWSIGMAPMRRSTIIWQKYVVCLASALILSLSLLMLSNQVLQVDPLLQAVSFFATILLALGLSSLSIGLGALLPNFKEDNPARIANGIGGTANAILSLFYIGVSIGMIGIPIHLHLQGELATWGFWQRWGVVWMGLFAALQLAVIAAPMALGIRKWNRLEF